MNRSSESKREADAPAELESQFILRLPREPSKILREMIQSGANNLKDRLSVRIENDMRTGEVRLDHLLLHSKVFDLPTVIESLKTIDNKTFYKTADICQIVICKEDDDQTTTDDETPTKNKKKDPNKVDKKYLFPHGVTPPMKNVRRRRFRKTLKKKYVEAPEIEKEVKRLLRVDNEAVNVKWEVINEDDEKSKVLDGKEEGTAEKIVKIEKPTSSHAESNVKPSVGIAEHDIFGGEVSDSDDEANMNMMEIEDTSRLSADSSRLSDSASRGVISSSAPGPSMIDKSKDLITEFSKEMFSPSRRPKEERNSDRYGMEQGNLYRDVKLESYATPKREEDTVSKDVLKERMNVLEKELADLRTRRQQQELEVANIENMALRQRFQDIVDNLLTEQMQKEQEYNEVRLLCQKFF